MNTYNDDLHFDLILPKIQAANHIAALKTLSDHAAQALNVSAEKLFELIREKEEQSSSGLEGGIAIPHIQVRGPQSKFKILCSLQRPVDFNAIDGTRADIICLIISPQKDGALHLRSLSRISRLLNNETLCKKLRDAKDEEAIQTLLIDPEGWLMAALNSETIFSILSAIKKFLRFAGSYIWKK